MKTLNPIKTLQIMSDKSIPHTAQCILEMLMRKDSKEFDSIVTAVLSCIQESGI
jgi:hypothetical protein